MIHPLDGNEGMKMRGTDEASGSLFSYVDLEARIPRSIRFARSGRW